MPNNKDGGGEVVPAARSTLREWFPGRPLRNLVFIVPQAGRSSDRSWHNERTNDGGWRMTYRALRLQSAWARDNLGTLADV